MSDKMEIVDQKKNPLMKREEVVFSLEHKGKATPSRMDMIKEIASKLNVKEDLLIIDRIISAKGNSKSSVKVLTYKKADDIPKGKLDKMKARLEKAKKKAAEAKPEKKPTETKEEAKEGKEKGPAEVKEATEAKEEKPAEEAKPEEKPAEAKEEKKEDKKE